MTTQPHTAPVYEHRWRVFVLAAMLVVAVAVVAWWGQATPRWVGVAVAAPLLAGVPGVVHGRRYTFAWMTLLTCAYIALGLVETLSNPGARTASVAILFGAFALFVGLIGYLRISRAAEPEG